MDKLVELFEFPELLNSKYDDFKIYDRKRYLLLESTVVGSFDRIIEILLNLVPEKTITVHLWRSSQY